MWGVELADPVTGRPAGALARDVQHRALRRGLILECGGRDDCVVRMLPPLDVTTETVDLACGILATSLREAVDGLPTASRAGGGAPADRARIPPRPPPPPPRGLGR